VALGYLFFAVLAAFFWALANIIDKNVVKDHVKNPLVITFFLGLFGALISLLLLPLGYVKIPSVFLFSTTLFLGILFAGFNYLYIKGLNEEEVSRVAPVISTTPVFVLLLEFLLLNQTFSSIQYTGISLAVIGSISVSSASIGIDFVKFKKNKAFFLVLLATISLAAYTVGIRWILNFSDYWNVFFWSRLGGLLFVIIFLIHDDTRRKISNLIRGNDKQKTFYMGLSELSNNFGVLSQTVALSLGAAALVQTVISIRPLFVLIFVVLLELLWDKSLGDELDRRNIIIKLLSIVMIILGIYLIQ
jgi:drug/metabolite transporter (DMT)-like permease